MAEKWQGNLNVYSEVCCDDCNEIIHNHFDCPGCGNAHVGSRQYYDLHEDYLDEGYGLLVCGECGARFECLDEPYDIDTEWFRMDLDIQ